MISIDYSLIIVFSVSYSGIFPIPCGLSRGLGGEWGLSGAFRLVRAGVGGLVCAIH